MFVHVERSHSNQLIFDHQEGQFPHSLDCMLPTLASITCDHSLTTPISYYNRFFFLFLHHVNFVDQFLLLRLCLRIQWFYLLFRQKSCLSRLSRIGRNSFRFNANSEDIILSLSNHNLPFFDIPFKLTYMLQEISPLMISLFL